MTPKPTTVRHAGWALLMSGALLLGSCSAGAKGSDGDLKVALFIEVANNSAVQSTITGVQDEAKKVGATVDVFDAKFDAATQVSQLQNALLRDYDAWIVAPVNGDVVCDVLTKQAAEQKIPVAVVTLPICGRSVNEGEELWAPGTLTYVGGNETPASFKAVMEHAIEENPGAHKVGVLTGPDLHPITLSYEKALAEIKQEHPDFEVVSKLRTDYSPPDSQAKAESMLQAQPAIDIIITVYSTMSKGVVAALQSSGRKPGEVKIYENGGAGWSVDQIKSGWLQSSTGFYRATAGATALKLIADHPDGQDVPHVVLNDGHNLLKGQSEGQVGLLTADNLAEYKAESP
ncbi:sugar ABC transporter substrate-binding protein [Amycolatopsis sp. lyj-90]|uniref:sugar ABC transporter substrate-binding protein n=1 Tax=Amycolatopsis sp. lyj-90 TaxID=2789285 RepID=UPI00397B6A2B